MIVTLRDPHILKTLEPSQVAAYLQLHGWQEQSRDGDKSSIWTRRNEAGEDYEILLPLQPEIGGFALRMYEVMETLEIAENRSQIEILADLITSLPNTTIQGVVMQIQNPNADKLSGEIALLGVVVDKLRKIQTSLADRDYIKAIKAYQERLPIVCTGDLIKENGHFTLKNPPSLCHRHRNRLGLFGNSSKSALELLIKLINDEIKNAIALGEETPQDNR